MSGQKKAHLITQEEWEMIFHYREAVKCSQKTPFGYKAAAMRSAIEQMNKLGNAGLRLSVYRCAYCAKWHLTHLAQ